MHWSACLYEIAIEWISFQSGGPLDCGLGLTRLQTAPGMLQDVWHGDKCMCVFVGFVWVRAFLLSTRLIDTDGCGLPVLCLSAPLSTDPCSGIYEPLGLIHSQIIWAGHIWTEHLSIFPTQLRPKHRGKTFSFFHQYKCWVLSGPQITRGDKVEVFKKAAGLKLDIRAVDEMFSQYATCLSADDAWLLEPNEGQWYVVLHALVNNCLLKWNSYWANKFSSIQSRDQMDCDKSKISQVTPFRSVFKGQQFISHFLISSIYDHIA